MNSAKLRQVLLAPQVGVGVGMLRWALRLFGLPYAAAMVVRNALYTWGWKAVHKSDLPVISVGNLSVGGTGKSPVVAWLAAWLRSHDVRVAVLSRGYGALDSGQNDEALELELQWPDVPHLQHWDRVASARLAQHELEMQCLVLDDGFQHRRLGRDLDIVLMDTTEPPAARWPLPGGLLREPLAALSRADVIILTRADQAQPESLARLHWLVQRRAPRALLTTACHRPTQLWSSPQRQESLEQLRGQPVLAFCAIGNPSSFVASLKALGADVLDSKFWPDHHAYCSDDVRWLCDWVALHPTAKRLVCTMKDWVKLQIDELADIPLSAVMIQLQFLDGQPQLECKLKELLALPRANAQL